MHYLDVALERIALSRGDTRVLQGVTWRVRPGERWCLLGHNGAGKTQLLKILAGDVWPAPHPRSRRIYRFGGERLEQPLGLKERIAYVGAERQDKYARYGWNLTVEELVGTGLFNTDIVLQRPDRAGRRRVNAALQRFGLRGLARRRLMRLSYGERRLALIARALVGRPRLLLLDEVFNGLDATHRERLMRVIESLKRSRLPWVLAAHRREDVPDSATHVIVLEQGRVKYAGRRNEAILRRALRYRTLQYCNSEDAPSRRIAILQSPVPATPLLVLRNVDVFVDHHPVLHDINWTLAAGEHWAVLGRNGSGKSTFLKLLYGDLPPALGGHVERAGFARGTHIEEFKRTVGFLSPELQSEQAREDSTVADIVVSGRHASIGLNEPASPGERRAVRRWIEFFGLQDWVERRARELSYGQLRRVLLARAMAASPRLLLLDEPCTGLDASTRAVVLAHLQRLAEAGVQLVMATHHPDDVVPAINRVLRLQRGSALPGAP
ncbi:MAG TPA: ATP-binding cassette domain-containing protein [Steroidobacteraceae bacterium]|nr:ATP-binding cassette domain-containing protein [Steroidobacteraceae bacterium]